MQELNRDGLLLAYHDRSDGGLFATLCEMAFAAHCGLTLDLDASAMARRPAQRVLGALFTEELGAVLQVRAQDRDAVLATPATPDRPARRRPIGSAERRATRSASMRGATPVFDATRIDLQRAWSRDHLAHAAAARQSRVRATRNTMRILRCERSRPARQA